MPPKTLRDEKLGKTNLRIVQRDNGTLAGRFQRSGESGRTIDGEPGETQEELWQRLRSAALREDPLFFGYAGAVARFKAIFPNGFEDSRYLKQERNYKIRAQKQLNQQVPIAEAAAGLVSIDSVVATFQKTNLVHWQGERPMIVDALRGGDGVKLVQHLANFALGEWDRLPTIAAICSRYEAAKWPIVTYLPFLWDSGREHALLRYKPTTAFAARVGHTFQGDYDSRLDRAVYESLLDLFETTRKEIADLNPTDWIDVQSFVWVVSEY